jgi:hypothetical protein
MSKGSNTTSTSTAPNPQAAAAYSNILNQAQQVAATPYNPYGGQLVAPVNQQQQTGIGTVNQYATAGVPYLQTAEGLQQGAANPLTAAQIQQYYSPYQANVVNATEQQFNNQNAMQQQQVLGNAAAQGALGGDRTAVAQSVLAGQQQAQEAPVIAGLENQGYAQALQTAGQQFQQNPEQAAYGIASTGNAIENAGLTGANAQVGAGTLEQQTQQAQDTAAYQQYMQAMQYPFATLGWEAGLASGVGSQMGGTSQTTAPAPNQTAQYAGLALAGAGMFLKEGGRVKSYDGGGAALPYGSAGIGWVPQVSITGGSGPPKPPGTAGAQSGVQSPLQMAAQASNLAGGLQGKGKSVLGNLMPGSPSYGGGNALSGDAWGGSASSPLPGLDASDYGVSGLADAGAGAADAGAAGVASAGADVAEMLPMLALANRGGRIHLRRGGAPVRAGLGMASFMPRRKFASGGGDDSDGDVVNFPSDRFVQPPVPAGLYNNSSGEANPLENIVKFQTYGLNSPYVPQHSSSSTASGTATDQADNDSVPPQITGRPQQQAGLGTSAMAFQDDGSRNASVAAPPDSVNAAQAARSAGDEEKSGIHFGLGLMSPDAKSALLAAGLGMMASRSPFLGTAIGEGGLAGLSAYSGLKNKEQDVDLKVKQLNQAAKAEQDRIALETKRESDLYSKMTPAQQAEVEFRQRNLERENLQPVKVGTDMSTGTDIYAVRDPTAPGGFRRIDPASYGAPHGTPMGTGAPVSSAAPTAPAVPNSDDASLPAKSTPVSGDIPDNVKPEILAALDPNVASQVKALDEGRMAFPTGFALSKPYWQNMLRLVSQYDPSFDAVNYNARAKTRSDFVAGKSAQNITSFNTAIGHLDTLDKTIDDLGNTRFGWLNPTLQSAKFAMGDQSFQESQKRFMAAKQAVTDELTRAFRGSGGNVHDIVGWEQTINQADSPAALHAATKAAVDLLRSRIESVGDQYNRGMGTTRDPLTMLSPHAQATIARLSGEAPAQKGTPSTTSVDPRDAAALKANAANPAAAAAIDRKYGAGTAARLLGAQ